MLQMLSMKHNILVAFLDYNSLTNSNAFLNTLPLRIQVPQAICQLQTQYTVSSKHNSFQWAQLAMLPLKTPEIKTKTE